MALLLLSGCAAAIDPGLARLCRIAIAGLEGTGVRIEVSDLRGLSQAGRIGVRYRLHHPDAAPAQRFAECIFAITPGRSPQPRDLTGMVLGGRPLREVRLHLLIGQWLERAESAAADPEPIAGTTRAPQVAASVARSLQVVIASLPLISVYALLAAAYSLLYGLVGRINLAFGEIAVGGALAAYLGTVVAGQGGAPWLIVTVAVVFAAWTAVIHGVVTARAVLAPLARRSGQMVLVATLGLSLALQEHFRLMQGARVHWVPPLLNDPFAVVRDADYIVALTPMAIVVTAVGIAAAGCVIAVLKWTRAGRWWRACADDPWAASLMGIDPRFTLIVTMGGASALAGLAGALTTIHYGGAGHAGGLVLGLKALIAAILGGIGSVPGAFLGGVAIGAAEAAWSAFLPIEHRDLFIFLLLAVVLALRRDAAHDLVSSHRLPR